MIEKGFFLKCIVCATYKINSKIDMRGIKYVEQQTYLDGKMSLKPSERSP